MTVAVVSWPKCIYPGSSWIALTRVSTPISHRPVYPPFASVARKQANRLIGKAVWHSAVIPSHDGDFNPAPMCAVRKCAAAGPSRSQSRRPQRPIPTDPASIAHERFVICAIGHAWRGWERESVTFRKDDRLCSRQSLCMRGFARQIHCMCAKMTAISGANRRLPLIYRRFLPTNVHVQTRANSPARDVKVPVGMTTHNRAMRKFAPAVATMAGCMSRARLCRRRRCVHGNR